MPFLYFLCKLFPNHSVNRLNLKFCSTDAAINLKKIRSLPMSNKILISFGLFASFANGQTVHPQTGRYADKYNLIDSDPSCRYDIPSDVCCVSAKTPQCPDVYSGPGDVDVMAIHPNLFERTEYFLRNMVRVRAHSALW